MPDYSSVTVGLLVTLLACAGCNSLRKSNPETAYLLADDEVVEQGIFSDVSNQLVSGDAFGGGSGTERSDGGGRICRCDAAVSRGRRDQWRARAAARSTMQARRSGVRRRPLAQFIHRRRSNVLPGRMRLFCGSISQSPIDLQSARDESIPVAATSIKPAIEDSKSQNIGLTTISKRATFPWRPTSCPGTAQHSTVSETQSNCWNAFGWMTRRVIWRTMRRCWPPPRALKRESTFEPTNC